jgi:hypothetical protein
MEEESMPTLDISPEKVAWVIIKAREYDGKVATYEDRGSDAADEDSGSILEDRREDSTKNELVSFIRGLNEDEQANLVALTWVGRETYALEDWDEALATARSERVNRTEAYLLGIPLLADYLEAGLEAFGYPVADLEDKLR